MILGTTFIHRKFIGFLCFLFKKYRRTRFHSFLHEKFIEFRGFYWILNTTIKLFPHFILHKRFKLLTLASTEI